MNHHREIDNALRELAQQRDRELGPPPMLRPARQALLTEFLSQELPLESALRQAAIKRDRLLNLPAGIPAPVELALQTRIAAHSIGGKSGGPVWRRLIRSPFAAALTACVMITAAVLFYRHEIPSRRNAGDVNADSVSVAFGMAKDRWFLGQAELFSRKVSIRPFDLNKSEPASLQASFFTNSGLYFDDENESRPGLRLDLPLRAVFVEPDLARTP